jgi:GT2 family glycosyltransferase
MCHQATIYRRQALERVGPYPVAFDVAGDYEFHLRCYLAGLRARFVADVIVDYDVEGKSCDVVATFRQLKAIQRAHAGALPRWVRWANEVIRAIEYGRIVGLRRLSATPVGAALRPAWVRLNRRVREGRVRHPREVDGFRR